MARALFILICALFAGMAHAQEYALDVRAGVGDVVAPPYTRLAVRVMRTDTRPFVGRIVVDFSDDMGMGGGRRGRRRGPGMSSGADIRVTQDVSLEEGAQGRIITMDVPVTGGFSPEVRLERQVGGDYFETVAATRASGSDIMDDRDVVAFVSSTRLEMAQDYFHFRVVEIPLADLPDSWKSLSGFDAIIINDDRLSRAQSAALADYLTTGGTVILSPGSAGSFNPETLAGTLLRIPSTSASRSVRISEFPSLLAGAPRLGHYPRGGGAPVEGTPDGEGAKGEPREPDTGDVDLELPSGEARMTLWQNPGRAKPVPGYEGLLSSARVGAGNLIFLHTDISSGPFVYGDSTPSLASVNLLTAAHEATRGRIGRNPMALVMERDVKRAVDIAGRRIPGRDALVVLLLVYIATAGVGMFIVARRIRRPELYPATLFVAALVSVALVFGFGELYKRAGDRVKTVRVLVSDETTERNALFTLGAGYAVDGEEYRFVNDRRVALMPAAMERRVAGGMPTDPYEFTTSYTGGEAQTRIEGLDRWQNVFFLQREPADLEDFSIGVEDMSGAFKVENRSPHQLRACVFVVGKSDVQPGDLTCDWHYLETLGPAGGDSGATFSESTVLPNDVTALAFRIEDTVDAHAMEVLGAMFNIDRDDMLGMAHNFQQIEGTLMRAGLLPEEGEFLFLSLLPPGAVSGSSIGASDVDDDDISQVNLWIVRGAVKAR